jgi:RNA polymerase sigma-70 factor, ECF subfamily
MGGATSREMGGATSREMGGATSRETDRMDFETFYRTEYEQVIKAAFALSGTWDVARDATQEGFARAYARWDRLKEQPWATGWVMTTALNCCRRQLRRQARQVPVSSFENSTSLEADHIRRLDLVASLRVLPLRRRQAIILFYFADLPITVIAELMHISEGAVKAHLSSGRQALAAALAPRESSESEETIRREGLEA